MTNNSVDLCGHFDLQKIINAYDFPVSQTSWGERYILLNISSIVDSDKPWLIIAEGGPSQLHRMQRDYSIDDRYLTTYTPSTYFKLTLLVWQTLQDACASFINKHARQFHGKAIDILAADENTTRPYVIILVNNRKFLLADSFDEFVVIRDAVQTKQVGYEHLRRVVYSWNAASIELFENLCRSRYNTHVLCFLNLSPFGCSEDVNLIHYARNKRMDNIMLFLPVESKYIGLCGNLPFIVYNRIIFPKRLVLSEKREFELMGSWHFEPQFKGSFPITVNFHEFKIHFYSEKFVMMPNDRTVYIESGDRYGLSLPFQTTTKHQMVISCTKCKNYHDHYRRCFYSHNNFSLEPKCVAHINRVTWCCILIKDFKDSANLVRAGTLSVVNSIAKLCHVVPVKYCNKYSKIDPYTFVEAYMLYKSRATENLINKFASFVEFANYFNGLDDKSLMLEDSIKDKDVIDMFGNITNPTVGSEADRQFVYFGLNHNIERFCALMGTLSSIFILPERCPIQILYNGLNFHSIINALAEAAWLEKVDVPSCREFFECDSVKALPPIKACKDFYNSKTPQCAHNYNFIKEECDHCISISKYHCQSMFALMKVCGLKFEDTIPKIIPRVEKTVAIIPILVKPNGLKGDNLRIIVDSLLSLDNTITIDACTAPSIIPFQMFEELYPAAAGNKRKFSKHWHNYMTSDVITIIFLRAPNLEVVRTAMLRARQLSNIEWTKNIVHSAENEDELELFFDQICKLFFTPSSVFKIDEPLDYFDGTCATLKDFYGRCKKQ